MSVSMGMTKAQVVEKYGPGLNTGNAMDGIRGHRWERTAYRSGNEGMSVEFTDDKVTRVEPRPDPVPGWKAKVQTGMSMQQVFQTLGQPQGGYSAQDHRPDQFWVYADPVAPIAMMTVYFKGGKVSDIQSGPNSALQ